MYTPSEAGETSARSSASHEDKLTVFCVRLLLNNGQPFNAWNPPDVDLLLLCFRYSLSLRMSLGANSVHFSSHSLLLRVEI